MKRIIQGIGLISFICFSFMYTDKVMEVINEKDSLMIEIVSKKDKYKIDFVEADIDKDTIIPGINGKEVNIDDSYQKMKEIGIFREDLLIYYTTYPKILLKNNYDKYIISGNNSKREVSLIFVVNNNNNIKELTDIINKYNVDVNLFVDYDILNKNNNIIHNNIELHSYGSNGVYTHENIMLSRNIIKSKTDNKTNYCLTLIKNKDLLNTCSKEKLFTIIPTINSNNNPYNDVKNSLKNGSIIKLELNNQTIKELPSIIDFINSKGIDIVYLSDLLSEEL